MSENEILQANDRTYVLSPRSLLNLCRTTKGWMDMLQKMVHERATLEQEYGKSLKKWTEKFNSKIENIASAEMQGVYGEMASVVQQALRNTLREAEHHKQVSHHLTAQDGPSAYLSFWTKSHPEKLSFGEGWQPRLKYQHRILSSAEKTHQQVVEKDIRDLMLLLVKHNDLSMSVEKYKEKAEVLYGELVSHNERLFEKKRYHADASVIYKAEAVRREKEESLNHVTTKYKHSTKLELLHRKDMIKNSEIVMKYIRHYEEGKLESLNRYLGSVIFHLFKTTPEHDAQWKALLDAVNQIDAESTFRNFVKENTFPIRLPGDAVNPTSCSPRKQTPSAMVRPFMSKDSVNSSVLSDDGKEVRPSTRQGDADDEDSDSVGESNKPVANKPDKKKLGLSKKSPRSPGSSENIKENISFLTNGALRQRDTGEEVNNGSRTSTGVHGGRCGIESSRIIQSGGTADNMPCGVGSKKIDKNKKASPVTSSNDKVSMRKKTSSVTSPSNNVSNISKISNISTCKQMSPVTAPSDNVSNIADSLKEDEVDLHSSRAGAIETKSPFPKVILVSEAIVCTENHEVSPRTTIQDDSRSQPDNDAKLSRSKTDEKDRRERREIERERRRSGAQRHRMDHENGARHNESSKPVRPSTPYRKTETASRLISSSDQAVSPWATGINKLKRMRRSALADNQTMSHPERRRPEALSDPTVVRSRVENGDKPEALIELKENNLSSLSSFSDLKLHSTHSKDSIKSGSDSRFQTALSRQSGDSNTQRDAPSSSSDVSIIELSEDFVTSHLGGSIEVELGGDSVETGMYRGGTPIWTAPGEGATLRHLHTSPGCTEVRIFESAQSHDADSIDDNQVKSKTKKKAQKSKKKSRESEKEGVTYTDVQQISFDATDSDLEDELFI